MKTLAERAKEYEPDPIDEAEILPVRVGFMVDKVRLGYINGAKEQEIIDTNEMAKLNEEWKLNLEVQRAMLIDKAVAVLVDSGIFGHNNSYGAKAFRKSMKE
nr:MAG TPA: hypothetical protein [Bacteriophage sp.]